MVDITFPTFDQGDVTVDSADIMGLTTSGAQTLVVMDDGHTVYNSPAPEELFEIAIASGGGPVVTANA